VSSREAHAVELVAADGSTVGVSTVDAAHRAPGLLHRAFSVVLVDAGGRLLLQQRAAVKTRFALRWANACCGHPAPGEPVTVAASRRLAEELGISSVPLTEVGVHVYAAGDPATGRVEQEYDHVLLGRFDAGTALAPDPAEVATVTWVSAADLDADLARAPSRYAPWLAGVVETCFS
jgi:isopentenyl-diphosphate delta-isomerase